MRALERVALPEVGSPYALLYSPIEGFDAFARGEADAISGLEAPDPHTLVIHLTEPTGDLAYRMGLPATAPIAPVAGRRLGVAQGHDLDLTPFLVSSGPYMFEGAPAFDPTHDPRDQEPQVRNDDPRWILVRNPSWDPATDDLRLAIADRIVFEPVPALDETPRSRAAMLEEIVRRLLENEADIPQFGFITPNLLERYGGRSEVAGRVHATESPTTALLTLDVARIPFDDVHVRRAVAHLLDRDAVRAAFTEAYSYAARPASHILPNGIEGGLLLDYVPFADGGDLAAARAEMAASRYDRDGDGLCDGGACRIVLPDRAEVGARVGVQLEAIGLRVRTEPPGDEAGSAIEDRPAMWSEGWWWPDFGNPATMLLPMVGSGGLSAATNSTLLGATPEQLVSWGYEVEEVPSVDDRLDRCLELVGPLQTECWARLDQYLMEEIVAVIPFGSVLYSYPTSDRVSRLAINAIGVPQLDRIVLSDA